MFRRKKRLSDYQLPLSSNSLKQQNNQGNTALATQEKEQKNGRSLAMTPTTPFEQPVVLRQSPFWSRFIFWTIFLIVSFGVGYAFIAEIEQVVPATGQLKPQDTVKKVQAPVDGVVETVYVEDGDTVEPGDLLMKFDTTSEQADLQSALAVKQSLQQENTFYRGLIESGDPAEIRKAIASLDLPASVLMLTKNREELQAENRLYRAQLGGDQAALSPEQQARLRTAEVESTSRENTAKLAIGQTRQELQQNKVQLIDARNNLETDKQIFANIQQRTRNSIQQAREALRIEQNILNDM
ncbi:MAG: biotin/lipoyl-binding protein, partial [Kamptonema sp. SIO4C4]|nr:biotin/lipoyl-binding protein [Kamptonema sp. SIO4C4]